MTLTEKLNELKAVCDAATSGPWNDNSYNKIYAPASQALGMFGMGPHIASIPCRSGDTPDEQGCNNRNFIRESRTAMPQLIEAVEELVAILEEHCLWDEYCSYISKILEVEG